MHIIVFFCLIILFILRLIGLGISLDFYSRTRDSKFLTLGLSWAFWLCSGLFPIISLIVIVPIYTDLLLIYNVLLTTIALLLLVKGLLIYFIEIKKEFLILTIIVIIFLSHLLYFIAGSKIAITTTSVISQVIWVLGILYPFIKWKMFTKHVDKRLWYIYVIIAIIGLIYLPISISIFAEGLSFGLYDADNIILIFLNYGYLIIITVFLHILTLHLEYTISQLEKFNLKDVYSHNLGNALQAIYTSLDLLSTPNINKKDEDELKTTLHNKLQEAGELLREIREL